MIVESVVVGLAVIGTYSAYRCIHQKVACWLKPHRCKAAERQPAPIDPTPSFTVELVRTVLEHQARREDQSRRDLVFLMSRMATTISQSELTSVSLFEPAEIPSSDCNGVHEPNTRCEMISRVIRRFLIWRKR